MRKKRTIAAAEEEQERLRRQPSQFRHSHFRKFISSVTSRSQSADVSLRDLRSEVEDRDIVRCDNLTSSGCYLSTVNLYQDCAHSCCLWTPSGETHWTVAQLLIGVN